MDEVPCCRVCHCESEPGNELFYPCRCDGSIKYVHQECLMQWLKFSKRKQRKCELCGEYFRFQNVYVDGTPAVVTSWEIIRELFPRLRLVALKAVNYALSGLLWGVALPLFSNWWITICWCIVSELDVSICHTAATAFAPSLESVTTAWYNGIINICVIVAVSVIIFETWQVIYKELVIAERNLRIRTLENRIAQNRAISQENIEQDRMRENKMMAFADFDSLRNEWELGKQAAKAAVVAPTSLHVTVRDPLLRRAMAKASEFMEEQQRNLLVLELECKYSKKAVQHLDDIYELIQLPNYTDLRDCFTRIDEVLTRQKDVFESVNAAAAVIFNVVGEDGCEILDEDKAENCLNDSDTDIFDESRLLKATATLEQSRVILENVAVMQRSVTEFHLQVTSQLEQILGSTPLSNSDGGYTSVTALGISPINSSASQLKAHRSNKTKSSEMNFESLTNDLHVTGEGFRFIESHIEQGYRPPEDRNTSLDKQLSNRADHNQEKTEMCELQYCPTSDSSMLEDQTSIVQDQQLRDKCSSLVTENVYHVGVSHITEVNEVLFDSTENGVSPSTAVNGARDTSAETFNVSHLHVSGMGSSVNGYSYAAGDTSTNKEISNLQGNRSKATAPTTNTDENPYCTTSACCTAVHNGIRSFDVLSDTDIHSEKFHQIKALETSICPSILSNDTKEYHSSVVRVDSNKTNIDIDEIYDSLRSGTEDLSLRNSNHQLSSIDTSKDNDDLLAEVFEHHNAQPNLTNDAETLEQKSILEFSGLDEEREEETIAKEVPIIDMESSNYDPPSAMPCSTEVTVQSPEELGQIPQQHRHQDTLVQHPRPVPPPAVPPPHAAVDIDFNAVQVQPMEVGGGFGDIAGAGRGAMEHAAAIDSLGYYHLLVCFFYVSLFAVAFIIIPAFMGKMIFEAPFMSSRFKEIIRSSVFDFLERDINVVLVSKLLSEFSDVSSSELLGDADNLAKLLPEKEHISAMFYQRFKVVIELCLGYVAILIGALVTYFSYCVRYMGGHSTAVEFGFRFKDFIFNQAHVVQLGINVGVKINMLLMAYGFAFPGFVCWLLAKCLGKLFPTFFDFPVQYTDIDASHVALIIVLYFASQCILVHIYNVLYELQQLMKKEYFFIGLPPSGEDGVAAFVPNQLAFPPPRAGGGARNRNHNLNWPAGRNHHVLSVQERLLNWTFSDVSKSLLVNLALVVPCTIATVLIPLRFGHCLCPLAWGAPLTFRYKVSFGDYQVPMEMILSHIMIPMLFEKLQYRGAVRSLLQVFCEYVLPAMGLEWILQPDAFPLLFPREDNPPVVPAAAHGGVDLVDVVPPVALGVEHVPGVADPEELVATAADDEPHNSSSLWTREAHSDDIPQDLSLQSYTVHNEKVSVDHNKMESALPLDVGHHDSSSIPMMSNDSILPIEHEILKNRESSESESAQTYDHETSALTESMTNEMALPEGDPAVNFSEETDGLLEEDTYLRSPRSLENLEHNGNIRSILPNWNALKRSPLVLRITVAIMVFLVGISLTTSWVLHAPLVLGRMTTKLIFPPLMDNDALTYPFGLLICWCVLRALSYIYTEVTNNMSLATLWRLTSKWTVVVGKVSAVAVVWLTIPPFAVGLLIEMLFVLPLRTSLYQSPQYPFLQCWAVGLVALKVWARCVLAGIFGDIPMRIHLETVLIRGFGAQFDATAAMQKVVVPVVTTTLDLLLMPYFLSRLVCMCLQSYLLRTVLVRFSIHIYIVIRLMAYAILSASRYLASLHNEIRDSRYLVGVQLTNRPGAETGAAVITTSNRDS